MKLNITYKKYSPEYKDQVIELLGNLWDFDNNMKIKYFKWKYEDNPFTDGVEGYIALHGDKVVAFRGCMVEPFVINESTYLIGLMGDMVTHPNYRRMGLFQSTTKYCLEMIDKNPRFMFCFNSSSGGPTSGGYINLGFVPMSERKNLFRFNLRGFFAKLLGNPKTFVRRTIEKKGTRMVITDEKDIDGMVAMPYETSRYSHIRDKEFYNWRLSNPRAKYKFAYLYKNGLMQAYIAFKDIGNARYDIIDFNQTMGDGLKLLIHAFSKVTHPTYISLWTVGKNNVIFKEYRRYGFINIGWLLYRFKKFQKPHFLINCLKPHQSMNGMAAESWDLYKIIADEI